MHFPSSVWRVLSALASLKFTLVIIIALALGVVAAYTSTVQAVWGLVGPLLAFALNLAAAVVTNPIFRRQTPLLVFHLALIAIVLLVAIGRLTYLKGQLELAEGEVFNGQLTQEESGPWHPLHLDALRFSNDGFTVAYAKGVRRGETRNQVTWTDSDGETRRDIIGDQVPLELSGYRFYTSHNKGFAPAFIWYPDSGATPMLGTVHLPSYPLHEYKQALEWTPPGSKSQLWVMLQFDEVILDPEKPSEFHLPTKYRIVVRSGEERHELNPGESLRLTDGLLVFEGLRSWMGYTVFYDFTLPWLLASGLLAVASLATHFWKKFSSRPWNASLGE
ncbi:MAG: cytochrome c biogenesis protein ResB [Gallionellaceae bacterium]